MRKTVPVYHPKTQQTSYQSPFTKNEYLQQLLRVRGAWLEMDSKQSKANDQPTLHSTLPVGAWQCDTTSKQLSTCNIRRWMAGLRSRSAARFTEGKHAVVWRRSMRACRTNDGAGSGFA